MKTMESGGVNEDGARERDRALSGRSGTLSPWPRARRWLTGRFGRPVARRTTLGGAIFAGSPSTWPATARC